MRLSWGRTVAPLLVVLLLGAGVVMTWSYVRAAALVVSVAGLGGWPDRLADLAANAPFGTRDLTVPTRHGPMPAREYRPGAARGPSVLVVPGVNPEGLDEPRLDAFARELARVGVTAITIAPADLTNFAISPRDTDRIEDAALWLVNRNDAQARRPGIVGISFGGGLALVAAGRPALNGRLSFVVSFGGHGDLPRVLRFLCTGEAPDGSRRRPHDYSVAVVLLGVLDKLVPSDQVEPLREAILTFMEASRLAMFDPMSAREWFAQARATEATLLEPAATWMRYVNARDVERAGPLLLTHALERGADPALSPERSAPTDADVYLLHGADDVVIPTTETTILAEYLRPHTRVHALITPLVTHAALDEAIDWREAWKVIRFWEPLLR